MRKTNQVRLRKYAWMTACAILITVGSQAQTSRPTGGVLLKPESPQVSRPNNGVLLRPQGPAILGGACTVNQLQLRFTTADDDLRGGKNNLNVQIHFADGSMQPVNNVNNSASWGNNSIHAVSIPLTKPVAPNQIKDITLIHSAQGSFKPNTSPLLVLSPETAAMEGIQSEDNWKMAEVHAYALGNGINVPIAYFGFHKFTGSDPSLDIHAQPGVGCPTGKQVTRIVFSFATADDDLRGGNDNVNIKILFADGSTQLEPNANRSQNWPNGSSERVEVVLNRPVTIDQIRGFTLADTFSGGVGGDNWNMESMQAEAYLEDGSHHSIAQSGFHKFSADVSGPTARQINISAHQIN
ncbi:MAG TPA: hypothetical protein VJ731_06340 [Terriglobales bacterium]|nr:hypothetical protein [Terriglobales bacterium]